MKIYFLGIDLFSHRWAPLIFQPTRTWLRFLFFLWLNQYQLLWQSWEFKSLYKSRNPVHEHWVDLRVLYLPQVWAEQPGSIMPLPHLKEPDLGHFHSTQLHLHLKRSNAGLFGWLVWFELFWLGVGFFYTASSTKSSGHHLRLLPLFSSYL